MGARAQRWKLWLITMFILTGIIGVFQLFDGPQSVGAVTVTGPTANPAAGLPERSFKATELPAWKPSASTSQTTQTRTSSVARTSAVPTTQVFLPAATPVGGTSTKAPSTTSVVISARSLASTATASATPKVTPTTPQPTTAPKPSQSVLKPTPTPTRARPTCYRVLLFQVCR